MTASIRLIKFGGPWCSHCVAMDKARTLEQFAAVTSDVVILKHDCPEPDSDLGDPIADAYDAMSMPTLVFEEISSGRELARFEGGLNLTSLREMYTTAKATQTGAETPPKSKRFTKQSVKYEPRVGGYAGVQARAEAAIGADTEALNAVENDTDTDTDTDTEPSDE